MDKKILPTINFMENTKLASRDSKQRKETIAWFFTQLMLERNKFQLHHIGMWRKWSKVLKSLECLQDKLELSHIEALSNFLQMLR